MAHGKETPRQKMIGMMYLVLTALLALNVQKEVLNAFVIVEEGITKMNENYSDKNAKMYDEFAKAVAEKPDKARKWNNIALEVRKRSNELFDLMQADKIEIVKMCEGDKTDAVKNGKVIPSLIESKETMDKPSQYMIVENHGKVLRNAIVKYREFLLQNIDPSAVGIKESLDNGLNTKDPPAVDNTTESWESEHFEHLPVVGVTTVLSGLQSNVRNAEADILRYLYSMIDKGTFKFTTIEATVIPNSNYIFQGNEYQAKVFLTAFDTVQKPSILIGPYDSTKLEDGSYTYKLRPGFKYDSIPVKNGKGIFTRKGTSIGYQNWSGVIKLKGPDGGADIIKPFKGEFQVAEPLLVVSPTKLNLFYTGIDNPVEISVPGVAGDKISATIDNGLIRKEGKGYIVNPKRLGPAHVTVTAEIEKGKRVNMGTKEFRVKLVPDPVAKVNGIKGSGSIDKAVLLAQTGVVAEMENFEFDLTFKVTEFTVETVVSGFSVEKSVKSNRFSNEQLTLMKNISRGQKVYITDIKAVGPDGTTRQLGSIALSIK